MLRAHKIRLDPTRAQAAYFAKACGVARFAWNWALSEWQRQYEAHKADPNLPRPTAFDLCRQMNAIKREQFPWMAEVTKCAPESGILNLGVAFKNWFDSLSGKRRGPKMGAPRFKKKGRHDSFKVTSTKFSVEGSRVRIPCLGWVRMRESLRFSGRPISLTVSRTADAWFAAITVETDDVPARCESQAAVGVDLGVKTLAVFSDDRPDVAGPKAMAVLLGRLRRASRAHSRKVKGSANRKKSARRLARLHWRIECRRNDALHKLTNMLTREYGWVAIEDLNVRGMLGNRSLARRVADAGFGEFRRQLEYKAALRGVTVSVVSRWLPSSKTCSECAVVNDALTLADRRWKCAGCGAEHDRDKNAARNILAASCAVSACGEEGSGERRKAPVKPASAKQESVLMAASP